MSDAGSPAQPPASAVLDPGPRSTIEPNTPGVEPSAERRPEPSGIAPAPTRRTMAAAIVTAALLVLLAALLRQTGVPKVDTIWAEDGAVFLDCAYGRSAIECLTTPYQGYLHLLPRLGAAVAASVPPPQASLVVALVAALTAAGAAALTARAVGAAAGSPLAAVVGGAGLGLVWQAGREVLGNLANLHWVVLTAALVVLVCAWIGPRLDGWDAALVAIAGLSSALAPLLVVPAVLAVILRRPGARLALAVAVAAALAQGATEVGTPREASGVAPLGLGDVVAAVADSVVGTGFFGELRTPPGWVIPAGIVLVSLVLLLASRARPRTALPGMAVVGALVALGLGIFAASVLLNRAANPRYGYVPAAISIPALAVASALAARALATTGSPGTLRPRSAALIVPAVALVLAVGFARSFRLEARASAGPDVPQELGAAAVACVAGTDDVTVPISPRPASSDWRLTVPCARLAR